jgi:nicotinamide phosphoribosyltransferase
MKLNPITLIDFYKSGHFFQYPNRTNMIYSNFTARSGKHFLIPDTSKVLFFGLQGIIKWLLIDTFNNDFFSKDIKVVLYDYQRRMDNALSPGAVTTEHIKSLHQLGYLPICIKALPEGSLVPFKVPCFTIRNTLPAFYWLTNYFEDMLSAESWKSINNATIAYEYRKLMQRYAEETGGMLDFCSWQGHDFSFRGMSGVHDAARSGAAHLVSFLGSDTVPAFDYLEAYYSGKDTFLGGSVPATEHSVMCMGGNETELETFRRLLTEVYPSGIVSIVSDTWDFWKVITEYATTLKSEILNRKPNMLGMATTVFRPDSGDPVEIICGSANIIKLQDERELQDISSLVCCIMENIVRDETTSREKGVDTCEGLFKLHGTIFRASVSLTWGNLGSTHYCIEHSQLVSIEVAVLTPAEKGAVECLWEIFGGKTNEAGFKCLHERVGLIYGDSITYDRAYEILERLKKKGFASSNIVFGIGSYTYQHSTRDSLGFAMKATYGEVDGEPRELWKDPITDSGIKKSAKGLLRVEKENGTYVLHDQQTWLEEASGALETVFLNGKLIKEQTIEEIRKRVGFIDR